MMNHRQSPWLLAWISLTAGTALLAIEVGTLSLLEERRPDASPLLIGAVSIAVMLVALGVLALLFQFSQDRHVPEGD